MTTTNWSSLSGKPCITISPSGGTGADYGPGQWQTFLSAIANNGWEGYALPGVHNISAGLTLPTTNQSYNLKLRGAGIGNTLLKFTGSGDFLTIPAAAAGASNRPIYNLDISDLGLIYNDQTQSSWIANLGNVATATIQRIMFASGVILDSGSTYGNVPGNLLSLAPYIPPSNFQSNVGGIFFPNQRNYTISIRGCTFALLVLGIRNEADWISTHDNNFWWCGLGNTSNAPNASNIVPSDVTNAGASTNSYRNNLPTNSLPSSIGGGILHHFNVLEAALANNAGQTYLNRSISINDQFYECQTGHIFAIGNWKSLAPLNPQPNTPVISGQNQFYSESIHLVISPIYELHYGFSAGGTTTNINPLVGVFRVYDDPAIFVHPAFSFAPGDVSSPASFSYPTPPNPTGDLNYWGVGVSGLDAGAFVIGAGYPAAYASIPPVARPLPANPPASGTWYLNLGPAFDLYVPVTFNPTASAAATAQFSLTRNTTNTAATAALPTTSFPAGGITGYQLLLQLRVPPGFFWQLNVANATVGNGYSCVLSY